MPLEFDTARVSVPAAPQRTDITCFVGYVRSRNAPLPRQVTEDLRAAGWIDGPWRRSRGATPHARAAAGRRRELGRLRSDIRLAFQARGGRQRGDLRLLSRRGGAAVLRAGRTTGDRRARGRPLAVHGRGRDESREPHGAHRPAGAAVRGSVAALRSDRPAHLAGNPAPLWTAGRQPRLHARSRRRVRRRSGATRRDTPTRADQRGLRRVQPLGGGPARRPRASLSACATLRMRTDCATGPGAVAEARAFLVRHRKDVVLIGALPLMASAAAQRDPLAYLQRQNVLLADGVDSRSRQQRLRPARLSLALDTGGLRPAAAARAA